MSVSEVIIDRPDGVPIRADLYRPTAPKTGVAVVMAHGIGGIKAAGLPPFARRFAAAGHTAIVFDYRHFGASGGTPREYLNLQRQREDYRSAIRFARALDGVRPDGIVVWGTSFAGMHVLRLAAENLGVAAAIAQCPLVDGAAGARGIEPLRLLRLTGVTLADLAGSAFGLGPRYIGLNVPEGEFGIISTEDSLYGRDILAPEDGTEWANHITARSLAEIVLTRPARDAARITCPLLILAAHGDSMAPVEPAVRAARRAPLGEYAIGTGGHYDMYAGGTDHEWSVQQQLEFIERVG